MNGAHQLANAAVAIAACELLGNKGFSVPLNSVRAGLQSVNWPGRFQIIGQNPTVVLDVAHNPASVQCLVAQLQKFYAEKKIYVVIGLMQDKDIQRIAEMISQVAYAVQPVASNFYRAMEAHNLLQQFSHYNVKLYEGRTVAHGVTNVLQICEKEDIVCITGSHYIAGEAMHTINCLTK